MDAETQHQIAHLIALRETHTKHLHVLELQAATLGMTAPTTIQVQIDELHEKIALLEREITKLSVAEAQWLQRIVPPVDDNGDYSSGDDMTDRLLLIGRYVVNIETAVHREMAAIFRLLDQQDEQDRIERHKRQRRVDLFYAIIIIMLVVIVLAIILL